MNREDFQTISITTWDIFLKYLNDNKNYKFVYRGMSSSCYELKTSLQRRIEEWVGVGCLKYALNIESKLIQEFRRLYKGNDDSIVQSDKLYCMGVMQHFGAPTRLLDWTYSPFVAARFAIERGGENCAIWCIRENWINDESKNCVSPETKKKIMKRDEDSKTRQNKTFENLFMSEMTSGEKFVRFENPFKLIDRNIVQQGIFICQGNVTDTFERNLRALNGWNEQRNIVKIILRLDRSQKEEFTLMLRRMNVDRLTLYPGLEGMARSLGERILEFCGDQ